MSKFLSGRNGIYLVGSNINFKYLSLVETDRNNFCANYRWIIINTIINKHKYNYK